MALLKGEKVLVLTEKGQFAVIKEGIMLSSQQADNPKSNISQMLEVAAGIGFKKTLMVVR